MTDNTSAFYAIIYGSFDPEECNELSRLCKDIEDAPTPTEQEEAPA